ncbi:hypothetical protein [Novosphingobium sp.]|uniref:hypothetical protein n=1 Tax=Novosphingobium sp. TaxID=1874826 RepID=UPI003D6D94CF
MKWTILASPLLLSLSACGQSPGEAAEKEFEVVEKNSSSTNGDLCRAAQKVADAYLAEHDQEKYDSWKLEAGLNCALPAGETAS